jgi:hypothetical protein
MSTITKKSLKVGKYVGKEHVDTVVRNYKQERWKYNTERLGKPDSLSAWWSVEELEEYIAMIKEHGADGIRFYFGAYSEDFEEVPEYAGRQTLVMVATKNTGEGKFDNKDIYVRNGKGIGPLAYNMSGMCPPFCDTTKPTTPTGGVGITLIDNGEKGMQII